MYSLNRATVLGNCTRDPETRQTPSGQSVCSFGVATNRTWTDAAGAKQEAADFHNVVAWGKLAEICGQYLAKGRKVYVEGRMQTRSWEGQDGAKRSTTEIIAENVILLDRAGAGTGAQASSPFSAPPVAKPATSVAKDDPAPNPDDEIKVEDIPF
jgi:single-strand DNA-binding protein